MKKILSIIICLLIIFSSISVASAASVSAYASAASVKRGDTVTVYVNVQSSDAVKGMSVSASYDTGIFDYAGYRWNVANISQQSFIPSDGNGVVLMSTDTIPVGSVFALSLKVKNNAVLGNSYVGFSFKLGSTGTVVSCGCNVNVACSHSYGSWTKDFGASCTTNGQESRICSICGNKEYRSIPAFGHSFTAWETMFEPNCTDTGSKERTCNTCGFVEKSSIPALGHKLGEDAETVKESTCTEHGTKKGVCTVCGEETTVEIPFAEHTWGVWEDVKAATCTESGERKHTCTVCGYSESQIALPLGHDFAQGEVIREATIFNEGLFEGICSRCGEGGSITTPCSFTDPDNKIYFETHPGVFKEGSEIYVEKNAEKHAETQQSSLASGWLSGLRKYINTLLGKTSEDINNETDSVKLAMRSVSEEYAAYNIYAYVNEESVQPDGSLLISFPIPESFGRNAAVYRISESGDCVDVSQSIDYANKKINASVDTLGLFAIADIDRLPEESISSPLDILHYSLEIGLFVLFILFLILFIWKKKGKESKHARKMNALDTDTVVVESDLTEFEEKSEISPDN